LSHAAATRPHLLTGALDPERLGRAGLWIVVFLGGFVIDEPAPYELVMVLVLGLWLLSGPRLPVAIAPLVVIVSLFLTGGLLATLMSDDFGEAIMYIAVTGFLAVTSVFFAAVVAHQPARLEVISKAYLASAVVVSLLGIAGYFGIGHSLFTLYGRAKGTFQDPNVFGPFLVLPWTVLVHALLNEPLVSRPLWRPAGRLAALAVLSLAILLSFSRAAWGLAVFSGLGVYLLVFIGTQDGRKRARLLGFALAGVLAFAALLVVALSVDSISGMLLQRAKLVQDYDAARLGRFARYVLGFEIVVDHPFGLGPLQFRNFFPEDEHNTYMKAFTTYGWLGGISYLALVIVTFRAMLPVVLQPRPWQWAARCVFVVLVGHVIMSFIIDTDRWRHLYMLYGLAWGLVACEQMYRAGIRRGNENGGRNDLSRLAQGARSG
jgi:O-antigen ligase